MKAHGMVGWTVYQKAVWTVALLVETTADERVDWMAGGRDRLWAALMADRTGD